MKVWVLMGVVLMTLRLISIQGDRFYTEAKFPKLDLGGNNCRSPDMA